MFYRTCARRCCCPCRRCPYGSCGNPSPIEPRSNGGRNCGCSDMAMTIVNGNSSNNSSGSGCSYTCSCSCGCR